METEYTVRDGKRVELKVYNAEEIKPLFSGDDWKRTFEDTLFLKNFGLTAPPTTFLVAISGTSIPAADGKVAGICTLRIDEKDRPKGFPVNWNHWDFYLREDGRVEMIPSNQKRSDHWYASQEAWEERVEERPPHEDVVD